MRFASRLREALAEVRLGARIADLKLTLALSARELSAEHVLDVASEATERLGAQDGRRVVVLLDEFQAVERLGDADLTRRLGAQFQPQPHVSCYLFLGGRPWLMWARLTTSAAASHRFAVPDELPTIPAEPGERAWRARLLYAV